MFVNEYFKSMIILNVSGIVFTTVNKREKILTSQSLRLTLDDRQ